MHLHPPPLVLTQVLPLRPAVISGLSMKGLYCSPWIQKNCHSLQCWSSLDIRGGRGLPEQVSSPGDVVIYPSPLLF